LWQKSKFGADKGTLPFLINTTHQNSNTYNQLKSVEPQKNTTCDFFSALSDGMGNALCHTPWKGQVSPDLPNYGQSLLCH